MKISIGSRTDVGGRSNNEDSLAVLSKDEAGLRVDAVLIIADGMGGRSNGEQASGIAVSSVTDAAIEHLAAPADQPLPPAEDLLAAGIRRANSKIFELSQSNKDAPGMGTTCIAAILDQATVTMAHVGDSRAYLIREDEVESLTTDHTYVAEQVKAGNLTVEDAKTSRFRNVITRAIGIAPTVAPDISAFPLLEDETLILCTDGLTNTLTEDQIYEIVRRSDDPQVNSDQLVAAAKAGGARDNISIITVKALSDSAVRKVRRPENPPKTAPRKPAEQPKPATAPSERSQSNGAAPDGTTTGSGTSSGFHVVAVAVLSALLGAAATAAALYEIGWLKSVQKTAAPAPSAVSAPTVPTSAQLTAASYSAPTRVYYKPVRSDFLLLGGSTIYSASQESGAIVSLNQSGQVLATYSGQPEANPVSADGSYYAVDSSGDLYVSDPSAGTISQRSISGGAARTISKGLNKPGAIAAASDGTVYFVEDGLLQVIHPQLAAGKP